MYGMDWYSNEPSNGKIKLKYFQACNYPTVLSVKWRASRLKSHITFYRADAKNTILYGP